MVLFGIGGIGAVVAHYVEEEAILDRTGDSEKAAYKLGKRRGYYGD